MNIKEYEAMYQQEEGHWWYAGMRAIMLALLPRSSLPLSPRCLDAGCGTGYNAVWLRSQHGAHVTGLDYYPNGFPFCRKREARDLVQGSVTDLPFAANSFDLVVCLDVITQVEHASGRLRALSEISRVLKPGGCALIRVAAFEWLRSSHDADVLTHHRYGRRELRDSMRAQKFQLIRFTFANTLLFPVALVWRGLKRLGLAPAGSDVRPTTRGTRGLNAFLRSIMNLEAAFLQNNNLSLPLGLSLIVVARKPWK